MTDENRTLGETIAAAAAKKPGDLPVDPDVKLPRAVRDAIAAGEEAFKKQKKRRLSKRDTALKRRGAAQISGTAVVDWEIHERREATLAKKALASQGKRRQPPMLERMRVFAVIVDRLLADGVPFATGRNSRMNKLVRKKQNEMASNSRDSRKSRRKQISPDAVQDLLRQIKDLEA
jgi:hypothetical protein